jgi:hypothetical protein
MNHLEVKRALLSRIGDLLDDTNGRRKIRTLERSEVLACLRSVINGKEFEWTHGGSVCSSYDYKAWTTVALAVRIEGTVYLGISIARADAATPGTAWNCLTPWRDGPCGQRRAEKLAAWAKDSEVTALSPGEVDSLQEAVTA